MTKQDALYLDDLVVGAEYRSADHALDAEQIRNFASQFDPQPFHLDDEAAQDSLFQGLSASGWHTASLTMKLWVSSFPLAKGLIGAGTEIKWPQPTRPTDILHVVSKILSITPSRTKTDRGIVAMQCRTLNQHGETLQDQVVKLVVMRRPKA